MLKLEDEPKMLGGRERKAAYLFMVDSVDTLACTEEAAGWDVTCTGLECRRATFCLMLKKPRLSRLCSVGLSCCSGAFDSRRGRINLDEACGMLNGGASLTSCCC